MAESTNRQFVVDASFVLAILLPDENVKALDNTLDLYAQGKIGFFSTHILPFEVLNGIRSAVLRKRINKNLATKLASHFFDLKIPVIDVDFGNTFQLAVRNNLTVYDASYVYLAKSKNIPLLTQDRQLAANN